MHLSFTYRTIHRRKVKGNGTKSINHNEFLLHYIIMVELSKIQFRKR